MDSATYPNSINIYLPAKKASWGAWLLSFLLASPAIAVLTNKTLNDFLTTGVTVGRWIGRVGNAVSIPAGTAGLTDEQRTNAQTIIEEGLKLGASQRDLEVAIAAALQECGLRNCDYGDRDSLGLFQQRPSQDWGSPAEVTDPKYAAQAFFKGAGTNPGLLNISDRGSMSLTEAAQAVQRSGFPDEYAKHEAVAKEVVAAALANRVPEAGGKTIPFKGIIVTSAKDASGEPGLDYVVENGRRGAEFGALAAGEVVEVVADQDWESHLEAGDTRRGYGNLVVVRSKDEASGENVDLLYAHMDEVLVQNGQTVEVGTPIGTQGRKGSTTGPHVSVDFFAPGTRTANAASLAMRDRIAQILQTNPESLNQQIQSAPLAPPKIPPVTEIVSLAKVELPKDLRLPSLQELTAAPQAAVSSFNFGAENNANATDPDRFTVEMWVMIEGTSAPASGIIIRQDGLILTNRHVVAAGLLYVKLRDGQQFTGRTIASDANLDLALVQLDGASGLPTATLAQSANVKPGDTVRAIGHPNGEMWKHTEAQVLATNSLCGLQALDNRCIRTPSGFLHPGNSGGPLLNASGEVIGVNRAIQESTGEGVSIPIEVFHQQFKIP